MVIDVGVANVLEEEAAIVAHEPAGECEQQLAEGWMNVEKVAPLEVVACELVVLISTRRVYGPIALRSATADSHTLPK